MAIIKLQPVLVPFVLAVCICCCSAATVQFYWEHDFNGAMYETTSSTSCKNLPDGFANVNGSVRTTGCIAVFQNANCPDQNYYYGLLVKSEEKRLSELYWKYEDKKGSTFTVSSYRDCTDMEKRSQVDFDLFEKQKLNGQMEPFRDVCSCTNLKYDGTTWKYRALKLYGDCLKIYNTANCGGVPSETQARTYHYYIGSYTQSVEPCHPPPVQCAVRFTGSIFKLQPKADISEPAIIQKEVPIGEKQVYLNNGSSPVELYFEAKKEISETFHFQLANAIPLINSITMDTAVYQDLGPMMILSHLQNRTETSLQAIKSNGTILSKRELNIREKLILSPCTKLEVTWLADKVEMEKTNFEAYLKVAATIQGSKKMEAKFIPHYFEHLNFLAKHDNFTAVTKTIVNLGLSYYTADRVNVTLEPIPECRKRFIKIKGHLTNISPITDTHNFTQYLQKYSMSARQIFTNNGNTKQEKNYQAAMEVAEMGYFQFPNELNRLISIGFHNDLNIDDAPSIPIVQDFWAKLVSVELKNEQDELVSEHPLKYIVQSNRTYEVQEKIAVSPCTEYEVESFVKIAKDAKIDYKIQFRVSGKLGADLVTIEEIRESLNGLTFLRNENNFTGVFETSAKLKLVYGVSSGVDVIETSIPSCRSRFVIYAGKVVNLERVSNSSNFTGSLNAIEIVPKQTFTNNGTSQQEDSYEAVKEITESAKFEFMNEMVAISLLKFEGDAIDELEKSISFFPAVRTKLSGGLSPTQSNWNETVEFGVKAKNEFRVQKNLVVAACTEYEVDSFIKIAENVETNYKVLLEVTGKLGGDAVRAEDIRKTLKDLNFLRNKDDFTVIAETTMKLKVTHGAGSGISAEGKQLLDCLAAQAEFLENCKFVCSE